MRRAILLLPLALAGCNLRRNEVAAIGAHMEIVAAASAARACGIVKLRIDPVDDARSRLLIDRTALAGGKACLDRWMAAHPSLRPARRA